MGELRHFTFMESWLDDLKDLDEKDKNEALWRIIDYGIYRRVDWDSIPVKERAWYKNTFRIIDNGVAISKVNAERGAQGGKKNQTHDKSRIREALLAGCTSAKAVCDYIGEPYGDWLYKVEDWKNRASIWKEAGIPMDSKGNPNFSNGKLLESNQNPMENTLESVGKSLETTGKELENGRKIVDSNGIQYDF